MSRQDRAVTPVISTILLVAIVVILAAVISVPSFGVAADLREPAPNVADTTGEFVVGSDVDEQVVRITHVAGDDVDISNVEIIIRISGPDVNTEARLVDLPGDGSFDRTLADKNVKKEDNINLINQVGPAFGQAYEGDQVIVVDDDNTWSAGDTIQFSLNGDAANFDESPDPGVDADTLEITIVHTPSNSILAEHTFTP
ncbi:type IV pilin [Haloglomus irregulare]|jgi:flagellin-like protein|uniref:Type IV pilin n=1 Tax=Haloglomus irregulare TaxID=2234134 RepID=A0A554N7U6_9EURY|nr:type IV pilin N-terminal domain-containing protein [Haloglomus irregulare]TSD13477.1 type IV pilin [Haloglomus irregulare]